ncbi:hypothetical protein SASPL_108150 [Salvia splendens]|uniref:Protein FAR1-RELATED SEQUENCE n=1 Tax=Salvia splendens TaxID=180675 RepID=A0A8X8YET3_SALSN|nr:hypothetical protein SASPL_108150 [Salvia splendens]
MYFLSVLSENMNDQLYIPQVANDRKPKIGMQFESIDDAFEFYNQYAREAGFSARYSNSRKNKMTNEVVWKQLVCFKAGQTDEARSKNRAPTGGLIQIRVRGEVRTNCKANISIVKQQTGSEWSVSVFMEGHNHGLFTPSKVHLLWSHRSVSAVKRVLTQQFSEANIPTCQQMQLLEMESGGPESVGCTEKHIRNLERELRDEQKGIDAETLIEFFTSEKEKISSFFFDYETDSDHIFKRCFWADPKSSRAYGAFGDVVVFYSTYNTNKYGMIFTPFVGVNHHHQTIVFGCGFLSDEKTESYIWLLNKFMEAMSSDAPKTIITDQDPAMTKALAQVLPETVHRYCLWHILNKFSEKISIVTFRDYYQSIRNIIKNSTSPEEFENGWKEGTKFLDEQLDYIHGKIKEMGISPTTMHGSQTRKSLDKTKTIGDPSKIRSKGCGKRMLSSKEKSILKTRACRGCGLHGASHGKRDCPKLQDISVAYDHHDISEYANERA